jgi:FAD synthetase
MRKVLAFGTFDILHPGHEHALTEARGLGDHLTVIIARDTTVEKVKNKKPLFDEQTRLKKSRESAYCRQGQAGKSGR